jgi:hypothetical protein
MPENNNGNDGHSDHSDNESENQNQSPPGNHIDISLNDTYSVTDASFASAVCIDDASYNVLTDPSYVSRTIIVRDLSQSIVSGVGYQVTASTGDDVSGNFVTHVDFTSTQPNIYDPNITENLTETVSMYDDETDPNSQTVLLLNKIRGYAQDISCNSFHEKGSIEDYTALFQAAAKIADDSKHMELNVDIEGFNEFAKAADDLSELFGGFITKLQNVNIITDINFLQSIALALEKIVNLSNVFGKFKEVVFATSQIQIPKSSHDATVIIRGVMDEVNCAMQYINYFVDPESNPTLVDAALSAAEKNIITQSVNTINSWNVLCEQGVSIAMANDPDVQYIHQASTELVSMTSSLKTATSALKSKLAAFNIRC